MRYPFLPGDIFLLYGGDSPFDRLEKWALGSPFVHCMMYLGPVNITQQQRWIIPRQMPPMLIESIGRGVCMTALHDYAGKRTRCLRWAGEDNNMVGVLAATAALDIATDPDSYYDYLALTEWVLPRLICQKLGLPVPLSWHRNRYFLCSELIAEVYSNAGYPIVPDDIVPLPGDFAESPKLESLGDITL